MKPVTVAFHLHPYKLDAPILMLELVHPREDGFWLLNGLVEHESQQWLLELLAVLDEISATTSTHEDVCSMDYYYISFQVPNLVEITHEYQPGWAFRLSYTNLAKIIKAILAYENQPVESYLELVLTDKEGPYPIPNNASNA